MTQPLNPEAAGRLAAEALVAQLDALKRQLGGPDASPARQMVAGEAAVEALKQVLGGVTKDMLPPGRP